MPYSDLANYESAIFPKAWRLEGEWRESPLFVYLKIEGVCKKIAKVFSPPLPVKSIYMLTVNGAGGYRLVEEREKIMRFIQKQININPNFLQKHLDGCSEAVNDLVKFSQKIEKEKVQLATNEKLIELFQLTCNKFIEAMPFLVSFEYLNEIMENVVSDELKKVIAKNKNLVTDYENHLNILTHCRQLSATEKEPIALYKIGALMQKISKNNFNKALNNPKIARLLNKHVQQYSWMKIYSFLGKPFAKANYIGRLKELYTDDFAKLIKEHKQNSLQNDKNWQKIKKFYLKNKNHSLINKSEITQRAIFIRAIRFQMMNYAYFLTLNLFREITDRIGDIDFAKVVWLLPNEIIDLLKGDFFDWRGVIQEREKGFTGLGSAQGNVILSGDDNIAITEHFSSKINPPKLATAEQIITGQPANKGVASGPVKIVLTAEDLGKVQKGDILVAKMTNADLVAGLEKASAFITDEGGILCHAAIVSREMQKPCIIGTKNATRLLRDGQMVKVDANEGKIIPLLPSPEIKNKPVKINFPPIIPFTKLSIAQINVAGGKGASLGELINKKIPVPPGFVVSTTVFEDFLIKNKIHPQKISKLIARADEKNMEKISKELRYLIEGNKFPSCYEEEINKNLRDFPAKYYAVRSSATMEDSDNNSFAGQLDTFLNISPKEIITNIKKCWGSLYTPRALFYRKKKKLDDKFVSVAVVVQKMVNSQISGIAFTTDPVSRNPNLLVIEAGFGLGEAIVSGRITPDHYAIDKKELILKEKIINEQREIILLEKNKTVIKKLAAAEGKKQKLGEKQIFELTKICLHIEEVYQKPMDIEWAYDGNELFITQARPITTL